MLVACDIRCFAPHPLEAALGEIRTAGLTEVELPLAAVTAGIDGDMGAGESARRARGMLDDLGLSAAAVHVGSLNGDESPAELATRLDQVLTLGSTLVVVDAGGTAGRVPYEALAAALRRLSDSAAERGATVAFDPLPGLRCDAREMLRILQDVDGAALRLCFDTGAYAAQHPGSGEVALQRVCTHLGAVRLRDATGIAGEDDYPPLGQGAAVDFTRTREVLSAIAFRGPCTISFTLRRRRAPTTMDECRTGLIRSLAQLRRGGWLAGGNVAMTARRLSIAELRQLVGQELGTSGWVEVAQQQVRQFAEATGDRQWIHCDPERAERESPYGTTIAHGYLTLSLGPALMSQIVEFFGVRLAINYGLNRVRFPTPVRVGRRVRLRLTLLGTEDVPDGVQITFSQTIDVEGESKPACVAECVWRLYPGEDATV